jgi:hypothetical protein
MMLGGSRIGRPSRFGRRPRHVARIKIRDIEGINQHAREYCNVGDDV